MEEGKKRVQGVVRIVHATRNSLEGVRAALRHEEAFRWELAAAVFLVPLGLWLGESGAERALLVASVLLVLLVELLNSGIEAAVDRVSAEHHPLARRAKDLGSAAVMGSLVVAGAVWVLVLLG
jgi:diacylglycerol kinase (ATP)